MMIIIDDVTPVTLRVGAILHGEQTYNNISGVMTSHQ